MRVKCLAQKHNPVPWPWAEPRLLNLESSAQTIRPFGFPQSHALGPLNLTGLQVTVKGIDDKNTMSTFFHRFK